MIHINSFVRRQLPEPGMRPSTQYSYFTGSDDELIKKLTWEDGTRRAGRNGYRRGVLLVDVDPRGFFSSVVTLQEGDKLVGEFVPRREGETPRKTLRTVRLAPQPAQRVEIVLYASPVLAEGGDNELPAEEGNWEVISINAFPTDEILPIHPEVLMHNHFGSDGGTATGMSDSEFVEALRESFEAWKDKVQGTVGE